MNAEEAALRAYYEGDEERDRLSDGRGQLEFIRTTEILMADPALPHRAGPVGRPGDCTGIGETFPGGHSVSE